MTGTVDRNKDAAVRSITEVLTLKDVEAVQDLYAHPDDWDRDEVVFRDGTVIESYADFVEFFEREMAKFEDFSTAIESVVAEDDEVMVQWTLSGRITEEFLGIPATAREFETMAASTFRFEDGEIVDQHDHVNYLDMMPEVAKVARRGIAGEIRDAIVVIDGDEYVIDVNPATVETFNVDRDDLLGKRVATLVGEGAPVPEAGESTVITGPDERQYFEMRASPLTDMSGDRIGRTLVLREITERRRLIQQLQVLNRVLRHNLRNDLQVIKGTIDIVSERTDGLSPHLSNAQAVIDDLLATAETARQVESLIQETDRERYDLHAVVPSLLDRAREVHPAATVEASVPNPVTVEATVGLEKALWELLDNACEHAGDAPQVDVSVTAGTDAAEIVVVDDGPGLSEYERRVLETGEETDLDHGSGLGLWLTQWLVEASGGTLSFTVDGGTIVRATLPLAMDN